MKNRKKKQKAIPFMVIVTKLKYNWKIKEYYTKEEKPLVEKLYYYDFLDKYLTKLKRRTGSSFKDISIEMREV